MSTFQVKASITASDDGTTATLNRIRGVLRSIAADSKKIGAIKLKLEGSRDIKSAVSAMNSLIARYDRLATSAGKAVGGVSRLNALLSQQSAIVQGMPRFRSQAPLAGRLGGTAGGVTGVMGSGHGLRDAAPLRARHATITAGVNTAQSGGAAVVREDADRFRAVIENLPPAIQRAIDTGAFNAATRFRTVNQSEINATTRAGVSNLKDMSEANAAKLTDIFAQALTFEKIRTGNEDEARKATDRFGKIADFAGKADTPEKLGKMMSLLTAANMAAGRDLSSEKLMTGARGLKTVLPSMSDKALVSLIAGIDEIGQRAGNELFQFVDSFTGMRTNKKALEYQKSLGLRDSKGRAVDEQLLRINPFEWGEKYIKPLMEKQGAKFDGTPEDDALIGKLANKFGLRQTAENFMVREMQKIDERRRFWEKTQRVGEKLTPENAMKASAGSIQLAAESVRASFGLLADSLTRDVQPAIKGTLDWISNKLAEGSKDAQQGKLSQAGMFIGGALTAGVTLAIREAMNNPSQAAHTAAMGIHSAALLKGSMPSVGNIPIPMGGKGATPPVVGAVGGGSLLGALGTAGAIVTLGYAAIKTAEHLGEIRKNSPEAQELRRKELEKIAKRKAEQEEFLTKNSRVYKPRNPLLAQDDSTGVDELAQKIAEANEKANRRPPSERTRSEVARREENDRVKSQINLNATRVLFNQGRSSELDSPGEKNRAKAWKSTEPDLKPLSDLTGSMEGFGAVVNALPAKGSEFGDNAKSKLNDGSSWGSSAAAAISAGLQGVIGQLSNLKIGVSGVPGKTAGSPGAEAP